MSMKMLRVIFVIVFALFVVSCGGGAGVETQDAQNEQAMEQATAHLLSGRFEEAIEVLDVLLERTPTFEAYHLRGALHFFMQNMQFALSDMNKAISLRADEVDAYILRGSIYVALEQYDLALLDASQAEELGLQNASVTNQASVYHIQAISYYKLGDTFVALEHIDKAIYKTQKTN